VRLSDFVLRLLPALPALLLVIREKVDRLLTTLALLGARLDRLLEQLGRFADIKGVDAEAHVRTRVLVADDAFVHQVELPEDIVARNVLVVRLRVAGV